MRQVLYIFGLLFFGFSSIAFAQKDVKVGFIDVQYILSESKAGKKAKSDIEAYVSKRKKELNKEEKKLDSLKKDFDKNKLTMTKSQIQEKQVEFQKKLVAYQKKAKESGQEVDKKKRDYQNRALKELKKIVDEYAAKEGYQFILEKNETGLLFSEKDLDITEKIMPTFNKRVK